MRALPKIALQLFHSMNSNESLLVLLVSRNKGPEEGIQLAKQGPHVTAWPPRGQDRGSPISVDDVFQSSNTTHGERVLQDRKWSYIVESKNEDEK